jgi:hypothetical protein
MSNICLRRNIKFAIQPEEKLHMEIWWDGMVTGMVTISQEIQFDSINKPIIIALTDPGQDG